MLPEERAESVAGVGVVADPLGDDVARAFEGGVGIGDFFFCVDVAECLFGGVAGVLVFEEVLGQWFEAFFAGDGGLGAALGAEGQVDVFELGEGLGGGEFVL